MEKEKFRKIIDEFFEGTAELMEWEDFERFMENRKISKEVKIEETIKDFPFTHFLNKRKSAEERLMKVTPDTINIYIGYRSLSKDHKLFIEKLIKKYGPYIYSSQDIDFGIEFKREKNVIKIVLGFATVDVEGVLRNNSETTASKFVLYGAPTIDFKIALETNDGVIFQRTPFGVILYNRHPKKEYKTLNDIYERYS